MSDPSSPALTARPWHAFPAVLRNAGDATGAGARLGKGGGRSRVAHPALYCYCPHPYIPYSRPSSPSPLLLTRHVPHCDLKPTNSSTSMTVDISTPLSPRTSDDLGSSDPHRPRSLQSPTPSSTPKKRRKLPWRSTKSFPRRQREPWVTKSFFPYTGEREDWLSRALEAARLASRSWLLAQKCGQWDAIDGDCLTLAVFDRVYEM